MLSHILYKKKINKINYLHRYIKKDQQNQLFSI